MRERSAIGIALAVAGVVALGTQATTAAQQQPREQESGLLFAQTASRDQPFNAGRVEQLKAGMRLAADAHPSGSGLPCANC